MGTEDAESFVVALPSIPKGKGTLENCTIKIPDRLLMVYDSKTKSDWTSTGIEYVPYFYKNVSCSFCVHIRILRKLEETTGVKYLDIDWDITTYHTGKIYQIENEKVINETIVDHEGETEKAKNGTLLVHENEMNKVKNETVLDNKDEMLVKNRTNIFYMPGTWWYELNMGRPVYLDVELEYFRPQKMSEYQNYSSVFQ